LTLPRQRAVRLAPRLAAVSLRGLLEQRPRDGAGGHGSPCERVSNRSGSGALAPHGKPIRLPTRPIHITTDIPSRQALVAFNNPSALRVYTINDDATLGEEVPQRGPIDAGILRPPGAGNGEQTGWRSSSRAATIRRGASPRTRVR